MAGWLAGVDGMDHLKSQQVVTQTPTLQPPAERSRRQGDTENCVDIDSQPPPAVEIRQRNSQAHIKSEVCHHSNGKMPSPRRYDLQVQTEGINTTTAAAAAADVAADYHHPTADTLAAAPPPDAHFVDDTVARAVRLRESFAAFIGITMAFTVINFLFVNITGGCLVLFGLLSSVWCFLDRHHTTYLLNAILQLLLAVTVSIAVSVYFPGFEAYSTDAVLRSISIAHVPLAFVFAVLSLYLAWRDFYELDSIDRHCYDDYGMTSTRYKTDRPTTGKRCSGGTRTSAA